MKLRRLIACASLTAWLAAVAAPWALASQSNVWSPTTGTVSGLQLTNNFNAGLDALNTCNSGSSAPTNQLSGTPSLGNCWINTATTPYAWYVHDGNAHWVLRGYIDPSTGQLYPVGTGGVGTIVAVSTTDLGTIPQSVITVTGTTTITSFGSSALPGSTRRLIFQAATPITYSSALLLPGGVSHTFASGDVIDATYLGGGNWQVTIVTLASGQAVSNPAVPVGSIIAYAGVTAPTNFDFAYGQTYSRSGFPQLLTALTSTQSVSRTNGSPTLTGFTDTTQFATGMPVEGAGIPTGATISSTTSTTVTLSANATSTGTSNAIVYPYGNGDGSTTFNLPDMRGRAMAGRDNMGGTAAGILSSSFYGASPDALGVAGGSQSHTLTQAELPAVAPTFTGTPSSTAFTYLNSITGTGALGVTSGATNILQTAVTLTPNGTISNLGSGNAHTIVQPTRTVNYIVRILP